MQTHWIAAQAEMDYRADELHRAAQRHRMVAEARRYRRRRRIAWPKVFTRHPHDFQLGRPRAA